MFPTIFPLSFISAPFYRLASTKSPFGGFFISSLLGLLNKDPTKFLFQPQAAGLFNIFPIRFLFQLYYDRMASTKSPSRVCFSSKSSGGLEMIKEEPLSEEDLRAIQKDRQKKDNHNMSKYMHIHKYFRTQGRSFLEHTIF